jgi:2',3'-cyclic-nucleotide 2'-phosphodiesterase
MDKDHLNILCIGDVVGEPGRTLIAKHYQRIIKVHDIDFSILNIENAAHGIGFTKKTYQELIIYGIDAFTSGNHVYRKKEIVEDFDDLKKLVRPWNFPPNNPGQGYRIFTVKNLKIAVVNLIGRVFLGLADCPFQLMQNKIADLKKEADIILVDMHAEATSEKQALGWMLDGQVNAVYGTHTHVQTTDSRILPNHTAYITDVGMVGAKNSILGMQKEEIVQKFLNQMPVKFSPPDTNNVLFNALKLTIDIHSKKTIKVETINQDYLI